MTVLSTAETIKMRVASKIKKISLQPSLHYLDPSSVEYRAGDYDVESLKRAIRRHGTVCVSGGYTKLTYQQYLDTEPTPVGPSLHEIGLVPVCEKCDNDRVVLISCCSGAQCGCLGLPIDAIFCPACNADGNIEPSDNIRSEWPFFFGDVAE